MAGDHSSFPLQRGKVSGEAQIKLSSGWASIRTVVVRIIIRLEEDVVILTSSNPIPK